MTNVTQGRFEIGRVLSRAMGVISRNFPVMALLALVLSGLPSLVIILATGGAATPFVGSGPGAMAPTAAAAALVGGLVSIVTSTLLQAALIHVTVSDLNGRPTNIGDSLGTAVRHILPLIGIALLSALA